MYLSVLKLWILCLAHVCSCKLCSVTSELVFASDSWILNEMRDSNVSMYSVLCLRSQTQYKFTFPCWFWEAPGSGSVQEVQFLCVNWLCVCVCKRRQLERKCFHTAAFPLQLHSPKFGDNKGLFTPPAQPLQLTPSNCKRMIEIIVIIYKNKIFHYSFNAPLLSTVGLLHNLDLMNH